jgi:signal transduction histidine kinase
VKSYINWSISIVIIILGSITVYLIQENYKTNKHEKRQLLLKSTHDRAINQFSNSIDKFAGILSGMRSYINLSEEIPNAEEFQLFVQAQLSAIDYKDSIVVSFIDTAHTFVYSFTRNSLNPANLVNKSVSSIRSDVEIARLNKLMQHDRIRLFYPINLIEGWLGIPLNFRVHRNNKTYGYVAPIISIKTIIQGLYDGNFNDEFQHHFSTESGEDFDREAVYDGSVIYNTLKDPEYYKNFEPDTSEFLYSTISYFGLNIRIGTGYKSSTTFDDQFTRVLYIFFLSFILFVLLITYQTTRLQKLNLRINNTNDLLELKREELATKNEELTTANQGKDKLFSIIGHDLKGPLNSIRGLLQILEFEKISDPSLRDVIQRLGYSTKNTSNLLDNLLRWARSQTGDLEFNPKQLSIHKLAEGVINELSQMASEKDIKIYETIDKDILHLIDADMIQTVFRNLISNAIKFTNKGGEIKLTSELTNNSLLLKVIDNGKGMESEHIDQLFKVNQHLTTEGTSGELGTGLGLLICSEFIKKHRGRIDVESVLGKGTSFIITLPF